MKEFVFLVILISLMACETEREEVAVRYQVSDATANTEVIYRDSNGEIITGFIVFNSVQDKWNYDFEQKRGEIVYLSARYSDTSSSVQLSVLIDGKIYKQGSSKNEPNQYVIVSGTIPY